MEPKEIEKLQTAIKGVCPDSYKVEIKQTKQASVRLIIIKEPPKTIALSDWGIFSAFPLHTSKILPLFGRTEDLRTLYCCGNLFMLFSPFNGVFNKFNGMIKYNVYGREFYQHYIGKCSDIDKLVAFVTETPYLLF